MDQLALVLRAKVKEKIEQLTFVSKVKLKIIFVSYLSIRYERL